MLLVAVSAHDIDAAGISLDVALPPAWLDEQLRDAELTAAGPGRLTARLSRSGDEIVVRGRVGADVTAPCARCLGPTPIHIDTELSLLLEPSPAAAPPKAPRGRAAAEANGKKKPAAEPEYEFQAHEADLDIYDGETVVLDPFVREAVLLEIPNFPLCSETCPGIGAAAPEPAEVEPAARIDPRLAPLAALRERVKDAAAPPKRPSNPPKAPRKKKNKE